MLRRFALVVILVACVLAGRSVASLAQGRSPDLRLVHYCDLRGDCSSTHAALRRVDPVVAVRIATIDESLAAFGELGIRHLPALVLYRDGAPVGAVVGATRPALLRSELARLEEAARSGSMPARTFAARQEPAPATDQVVYVELIVRRGEVRIVATEVFEGAAPRAKASQLDSHHVQLLAADGTPLVTRAWQALDVVVPPPPLPGQEGERAPGPVVTRRTAVVLPFHPAATTVRIEQPFGLESARADIDRRPLFDRSRGTATAIHNTGGDAARMVMLILGDQYKKKARKRFPTDAESITDFMLAGSAYDENVDNINVYRSSTLKGLKCDYTKAADGEDTRLLVCNTAKVLKKAARDKISYDQILVLVNNEKYGGSGGAIAVSYNRAGWEPGASTYGWGPEVAVHELGHSLLGLMDEYEYGISGAPWGPNCQAPPCTWSGSGLGCHDGCSYIGLARPTDRGCYMNVLQPDGGFGLCLVGLRHAREVLEAY